MDYYLAVTALLLKIIHDIVLYIVQLWTQNVLNSNGMFVKVGFSCRERTWSLSTLLVFLGQYNQGFIGVSIRRIIIFISRLTFLQLSTYLLVEVKNDLHVTISLILIIDKFLNSISRQLGLLSIISINPLVLIFKYLEL